MAAARAAKPYDGVLSRRILHELGIDRYGVRAELRAQRWRAHGRQTIAMHTGELSERARPWRAVWEVGHRTAALGGALEDDLRRGSTSVGPHRDDRSITVQGTDARSFASQGQQRTAVVSLKLAESDLIEARSGQRPILLLDDVLSELDPTRRGALLARVGETGQVIVTSVEAEPFPVALMERAAVRCISGGRVEACG